MELTLLRGFGMLVGIFLTYGMFEPVFLGFDCGGYISLQGDWSWMVCG